MTAMDGTEDSPFRSRFFLYAVQGVRPADLLPDFLHEGFRGDHPDDPLFQPANLFLVHDDSDSFQALCIDNC
jgi:hypothetical protein